MKNSKFNDIFKTFMLTEADEVQQADNSTELDSQDSINTEQTAEVDETIKKAAEDGFNFLKEKGYDTKEKRAEVINKAMGENPEGDAAELVAKIKAELGENANQSTEQTVVDSDPGNKTDDETRKRLEANQDEAEKWHESEEQKIRNYFRY